MKLIKVGSNIKKVVVLSGIPTSGKTTLGKLLKEQGYSYVPEIVESFIKKGFKTGTEANQLLDKKVMTAEFCRDKQLLSGKKDLIIIETWHIGNIAHAQLRNINVAKKYIKLFKKNAKKYRIYGIYLEIPYKTFWKRTKKYKDCNKQKTVSFFRLLRKQILKCYKEFKIPLQKINANRQIKLVLGDILDFIETIKET